MLFATLSYPRIALYLLAASGLAFGAALANPFLFDDRVVIAANDWLRIEMIPSFFRSFIHDSSLRFPGYRPFLMTTFVAEKEIFGLNPIPFRLTNILLHSAVAFLVFEFLRRALRTYTTSKWIPFVGALFFLLHPVQSNVITLIWKRSDLLVSFGIISALLLFWTWSETEKRNWKCLAGGLFMYLVATFSKESALIFLPTVLLCHFTLWQPEKSTKKHLFFVYLPATLIALAHAYVIFAIMPDTLTDKRFSYELMAPPDHQLSRMSYAMTQVSALIDYVILLINPSALRVYHDMPILHSMFHVRFFVGALLIMAFIAGAAIFWRQKRTVVAFAPLWFLVTLAPGSSFVPLNLAFDEDRLYLPMLSVALVVSFIIRNLFQYQKPLSYAAVAILMVLYTVGDNLRCRDWNDPVRLWWLNIQDEPDDERPWIQLGQALAKENKFEASAMAYQRAIQLNPKYVFPYLQLATFYLEREQLKKARKLLNEALGLKTFRWMTLNKLGVLEVKEGRKQVAAKYFRRSAQIKPTDQTSLWNLARLYEEQDKLAQALATLEEAFQRDPNDLGTQIRLAYHHWQHRKDAAKAKLLAKEVLKHLPGDPLATALLERIEKEAQGLD